MKGKCTGIVWVMAVIAGLLPASTQALERVEFTRMVAHWADYADPGYLSFVEEARPEVVQVGFYGAHFWSLADTPFGSGYPAHLPVRGHRECADWFKRLNGALHDRGAKVVGHMNVKFLVGDPDSSEGPRGFFRFYGSQWDENLLGPKPVSDPLDFLEKDRSGKPISDKTYSIGGMREYWACLNNPHWREVLKAWVRFGIAQGVDGFISNYFYRHDCLCPHCLSAFRHYLHERFTGEQLKARFAITNLDAHQFDEIVGWHDPAKSTPLRREMLRFSQIANKNAFDEVFVRFGRSLKPDLMVAQWNHLGDFSQINGDERCLLPGELWGRDEDYLWYSTGDAANSSELASGILGEATLQVRYIRGAFDDKPFTLGKYESTRIRVAIAELAANGGAPMGFYTNFKDPDARREIVRYYKFLRQYDHLYRANRPHAEVLLLFPRTRVHDGDVASVARFKEIGKSLLNRHVLFDVLPDDRAAPATRLRYEAVVDPSEASTTGNGVTNKLPSGLSRFDVPLTVRVSASHPASANEITLHFVNYNWQEPTDKSQRGFKYENPISAPAFEVDLHLPRDFTAKQIAFLTPEQEEPQRLDFKQTGTRLRLRVPEFLVYGVVRILLANAK
jgi:hypothetical protein